jgi:hypothetical protein
LEACILQSGDDVDWREFTKYLFPFLSRTHLAIRKSSGTLYATQQDSVPFQNQFPSLGILFWSTSYISSQFRPLNKNLRTA